MAKRICLALLIASCGAFPQPPRNQNPDAAPDTAAADTPNGASLAVTTLSPPDNSTGNQASTTTVTATFAETLDCAAITDASLKVSESGADVVGQVTCAAGTLTFQPTNGVLPTATTLLATIDASVRSVGGATLGAPRSWTFDVAPWTRQLGTAALDAPSAIVSDAAGNVYAVGYTSGALDGGTNVGLNDAFITKYSVTGARQWTRVFGTTANDQAYGIARDTAGDLVVVGSTKGDLQATNAGGEDLFVTKYDLGGNRTWMRQLGTSADDIARGVAIDPNGNIYVAGTTRGNLDGTSAGGYDGFVAKYNGSGALQWVRQFGTTADEGGSGAIADPSGNVYVTGYTSGSLDGTNAGATDIYLVKYDTTGVKQWTRQLGTSDYDAGDAIAIDGMGNIFIAGETMGGLDGNTSAGGQDLVLVKYNDAGSKLYTRQFGSTANDVGYGIAMNLGGEAYVTGNTAGGLEGNTNAGMQDLYVVKYALNGTRVWIRQMGSASYDVGLGITVLSNDVVVFGSTGGGVDGNTNAGATDCIIVKYQQDGRKR